MQGAGGQYAFVIPTHDLVVVRMGHYLGQEAGGHNLWKALQLLTDAVPQAREPWAVRLARGNRSGKHKRVGRNPKE